MTSGSQFLSPILNRSKMKNHTAVLFGTLGAILALEAVILAIRLVAG